MSLSSFFRKKKGPSYDVTNLSVLDLAINFAFDYDFRTWVVEESYEYDWGGNFFSREFRVFDGKERHFLHVEQDDDLALSLTKSTKTVHVKEDIRKAILKKGKAPKKLHYKDEQYRLDEESTGYFRNIKDTKEEAWSEIICWDYYNGEETSLLSISQTGENEIEVYHGVVIKAHQVANIIPGRAS